MKVRRFVADDMRAAIAMVREELGSDAVILSNRMVDDGVEILASNDYAGSVAKKSEPSGPTRRYRTYADIPDFEPAPAAEPAVPPSSPYGAFDEMLAEESVSLSSQAKTSPAGMAKANDIAARLKQKVSGTIFDRRTKTDQPIWEEPSQQAETAAPYNPEPVRSKPAQPDYSKYIVDDEPARQQPPLRDEEQQKLQAETESMREELKALRNLLESQMSMMNWEKHKQQNPVHAGLLKRLTELGLTVDVSQQILRQLQHIDNVEIASKRAISILVNTIPMASDEILTTAGVVALVGPTGVGKTTTIAKLAAHYVMSHGTDDIALVTLDNYRVGAQEQLYNYAKIMGVPVHNARNSEELYKVLQNLYDKNLVLIDTAGMSQKDMRICEQFNTLKKGAGEVRSYLVLSANAQTSALDEVVRAFKQTELNGCILTKLDESASLGGAISMLIRHQLPLTYTSNGQCVPEDLQTAHAKTLVSEALDMLKQQPEETSDQQLATSFNEGLLNVH